MHGPTDSATRLEKKSNVQNNKKKNDNNDKCEYL